MTNNFLHSKHRSGRLEGKRSDRLPLMFFFPEIKLENTFYVKIEDHPVIAPTLKWSFISAVLKNSFKVLTNVTKISVLDVTGLLDLSLVIEKIDLSFVL